MTPRPNSRHAAPTAIWAAALLSARSGWAQQQPSAEPEQLKTYRAAFQRQLDEADSVFRTELGDELARFERSMAAKGIYDAAIAAKQRRLALAATEKVAKPPEPDAVGDPAGTIHLEMASARFSKSGVSLDRAAGALVGWKNAGVSATWEAFGVQPGEYSVVVTYGCRSKSYNSDSESYRYAGGTFDVMEQTKLVAGGKVLSHKVSSTGGWDKKVEKAIGSLEITGTSTSISVTAQSVESLGLMYLYGLKLIPTGRTAEPAASAAAVDAGSIPAPLAKVRGTYRASAAATAKPVLADYLDRLAELEVSLLAAGQTDKARAVRTEKTRVELQRGDPAALIPLAQPAATEPSLAAIIGPAGLEKKHSDKLAEARRALVAPYDAALARLQTTLTNATRLQEALAVRTERKRVAALLPPAGDGSATVAERAEE